ncbi:MAG: spore coat associated protein CotJA [Ruminococcaceae bacterium]|nr:spore coat associated protein CotJA [Oscillospiraceae bacterium]
MRYMTNTSPGMGCPSACPQPRRVQPACRDAEPVCAALPVMASLEPQVWDCAYSCGQALTRGTLFPALDKPFMGKGGCCNG